MIQVNVLLQVQLESIRINLITHFGNHPRDLNDTMTTHVEGREYDVIFAGYASW